MDKILSAAEDLANQIASSSLYREYLYHKEQLMQKPKLWEKMRRLKALQFEIGQKRKNHEPVSFEEETALSELYSQLMLHKVAEDFWKSRQEMLQLQAKVFQIIAEKAPMDGIF
ncbi:MAG: YlbF family regulator [Epulopiscium sp.]|nr:YlbF family regulator [Candidatus Epulonipiscium sp.]